MAYIDQIKVVEIEKQITADPVFLGKLYQAKKNEYQVQTVDHNMVDTYLKDGWEVYGKSLKTKTRIRKLKSHSRKFEDDMWCQMYELGYRTLNISENLHLNFTNDDKKQIDVIAINEDTAIIIECKSSEKFKKASSLKDEFELLGMRLDGFKKNVASNLRQKPTRKIYFRYPKLKNRYGW
ncbi:hypothetical protein [Flavobacterium sp. N1718]|uniref:hypothetical protein n=1 Tax=Flavobacterium sp. N1718 TaxID=2986822 RepID=UPI002224D001|nr:hypothetical protein [Flavobacterium sp. N1718]